MHFQTRSPLEAPTALAALGNAIDGTIYLKGNIVGNRFSVRVVNGVFISLPGRGRLQGRIVPASNGCVVEGSYGNPYGLYATALAILCIGLLIYFLPDDLTTGGARLPALIVGIGLATLVVRMTSMDKALLRREIVKAVQGIS